MKTDFYLKFPWYVLYVKIYIYSSLQFNICKGYSFRYQQNLRVYIT
jgi:hypothetical protein